jgi:hypothetical protein
VAARSCVTIKMLTKYGIGEPGPRQRRIATTPATPGTAPTLPFDIVGCLPVEHAVEVLLLAIERSTEAAAVGSSGQHGATAPVPLPRLLPAARCPLGCRAPWCRGHGKQWSSTTSYGAHFARSEP